MCTLRESTVLALVAAVLGSACGDASPTTDGGAGADASGTDAVDGAARDGGSSTDATISSDSSAPGADASAPGADASAPGADAGGCPVPSRGRLVATSPTRLFRDLEVNGGTVFLHSPEGIYSVPEAGGALTTVFTEPKQTIQNPINFLADGRILVTNGNGEAGTIPRTGGPITPLAIVLPSADDFCGLDPATNELYAVGANERVVVFNLTTLTSRMLAASPKRFSRCTLLSTGVYGHHAATLVGGNLDAQSVVELPRDGSAAIIHALAPTAFGSEDGDGLAFLEGLALYIPSRNTDADFPVSRTDLAAMNDRVVHSFLGDTSFIGEAVSARRFGALRNRAVDRNDIATWLVEVVVLDANTTSATDPTIATLALSDECRFDAVGFGTTELFIAQRHNTRGVNLYAIPF